MLALGQTGLTGARSMQLVQSSLTTLTAGSKATTAMLAQLGVNVFNAQGKFIGMQSVIEQLRPKLVDLTGASQELALKALFGSGAWQVMGQIVGAGVPKFQAATTAANQLGTAHAAAVIQGKTLTDQWKLLQATVVDLGTKLGLQLVPALESVVKWLSDGVTWLEKHKAAAAALAVVISGVLGGAVANFAYVKAAAFVGGVQNMVTAMSGLATKILTTAGVMGTAETEMVAGAEATATAVDGAMLASGIGAALVALGVAAFLLKDHWQAVMNAMGNAVKWTANNVIIPALDLLIRGLNEVIKGIDASTLGLAGIKQVKLVPLIGGGAGGAAVSTAPSTAAQNAVSQSQKNLAAIVGGASLGFTSQASFNTNLLKSLGAPITPGNVAALTAWANAEKPFGTGPDTNNPLDITIAPGVSTNSAGVKAIPTSAAGALCDRPVHHAAHARRFSRRCGPGRARQRCPHW